MHWLFLVLIGQFIWSCTLLVDRYALSGKVKDTTMYLVLAGIVHVTVAGAIILTVGAQSLPLTTIAFLLAAGALEAISNYFLFTAVQTEEITRVLPLSSLSPILVLLGAWLFLGETLTSTSAIAFILLLIGGVLAALHFDGSRRVRLSRAIMPAAMMMVLGVVYTLLFKHALTGVDFWTAFWWNRLGFGLAIAPVLLFRYPTIRTSWRGLPTRFRAFITGNQVVAVLGHVFVFLALQQGPVSLVSAAGQAQPLIVFALATILSVFNPKLVKETIRPRELFQKGVSIICVVAAAILLALA